MNGLTRFGSAGLEDELVAELAEKFRQTDEAPAQVVSVADVVGLVIKCAEKLESGGHDVSQADDALSLIESNFLTNQAG